MEYKKYDVSVKLSLVEEYLKLRNENPKLRKCEFAYKHGIADSTFNDWVVKYLKDKDRYFCDSDKDEVNIFNNSLPAFIEISEDKVIKPFNNSSPFKLTYKGLTLEFKEDQLDKVLEVMKKW